MVVTADDVMIQCSPLSPALYNCYSSSYILHLLHALYIYSYYIWGSCMQLLRFLFQWLLPFKNYILLLSRSVTVQLLLSCMPIVDSAHPTCTAPLRAPHGTVCTATCDANTIHVVVTHCCNQSSICLEIWRPYITIVMYIRSWAGIKVRQHACLN